MSAFDDMMYFCSIVGKLEIKCRRDGSFDGI